MGNCICAAFKKLSSNEGGKWARADEMLLKSGDNYRRIEANGRRRVKIVMNKRQFEIMLAGSNEEKRLRRIALQSLATRFGKWRPSLAAIPELV